MRCEAYAREMATKKEKREASGFGLSELTGLPLVPTGDAKPERSAARSLAGVLDTALLVLVVLVAIAIAWWLISSVISTIFFFVKLAALAVVIAVLVRAWLWARRRRG
jgi:hypothetical protein